MTGEEMSSLERTLTAMDHREPDRVPLFLPLSLHGARELGMPLREYFSRADHVIRGQEVLTRRYPANDSLCPFFYGAIDYEAFGGEVLYFDDGPPNSGRPVIRTPGEIDALEPPEVGETACLEKVIDTTRTLHERYGDRKVIPGVVISPFSLPVMQMGFEAYLDLISTDRERFWTLMETNIRFAVEWANAQLEAGATAMVYFDPLSSPTMLTPEEIRGTGLRIARRVIREIRGTVAIHFASGRCLPVADDLPATGAVGVGVSALEDLARLKEAFRGKMTVIGNLDGISMAGWTPARAEEVVRWAIAAAGEGGGYILSDNHGEIPWQVTDQVLHAICDTVETWGRYPLPP